MAFPSPQSMALIASFTPGDLVPLLEKQATNEYGDLTLHSIVKHLTKEMLIKHAQHTETLLGLKVLESLQGEPSA
mgnify:CR=1 FL=1